MKFKQVKVDAIEGVPNADKDRLHFFTAEIPASVVADFEVERAIDVSGGFQRPLDKSRARQIGQLMGGDAKKDRAPVPHWHGGLLAYATEDEVSFSPTTRKLTIRKPVHLLDGQTRAAGAKWAVENGKEHEYTETVRIVVGATRDELVKIFLITNMTARKVQPSNVLLNVATMTGTQNNRKSWVSRIMLTLASEAPFTLGKGDDIKRVVSFATRDTGRLSAYTLYKAVNFLLPEDLNREGPDVEKKALKYARDAFKLYASLYEDVWGKTEEDGTLSKHDCYGFTLLAAFARFYKAVKASTVGGDVNEIVRKVWIKSTYDKGLPEGSGSGERSALSLASYAAAEAGLGAAAVDAAA